jgi:hypothetical protein
MYVARNSDLESFGLNLAPVKAQLMIIGLERMLYPSPTPDGFTTIGQ